MTKVLTIRFPETTQITEIHLLNVGEVFEGFGGSRHPLIAGRDFHTGEKQKKPTASLILRRTSAMGIEDVERQIDDPQFWAWIGRLISEAAPGVVAEPNPANLGKVMREKPSDTR